MKPAATPEALEQALRETLLQVRYGSVGVVPCPFAEQDEIIQNAINSDVSAILADLQRVTAERDEARADQKEAEDSNDALNMKLHNLAPHGSCACSYDKPGDVCLHHSPALATATAEAASLRAENEKLKGERSITDEDVTEAMRTFERYGGPLHYPEAQKWHLRDIMAMRFVLQQFDGRTALARAATAGEG